MSKTINKGRDYYRALQAKCRYLTNRKFYPRQVDTDKGAAFLLTRAAYEKKNIKVKHFKFTDAAGKEKSIPYQTCTYVRAGEEMSKAVADKLLLGQGVF